MKFPFIQFYPKDHVADEKLSRCCHATRSIWLEFVFAMHLDDRCGLISGSRPTLARSGRCTLEELCLAITELDETGAADVTERDGVVTLINRRMRSEWKKRNQTKLRVQEFRSNGPVTPKKPPITSGSDSDSSGSGVPEGKVAKGEGVPRPPQSELSDLGNRIAKWFRRRETTKWDAKELKVLREVEAKNTPEEDISLMEQRYLSNAPYIRQDLLTLLNNWNTEIDRSKKPNGVKPAVSTTPTWMRINAIEERIRALSSEFSIVKDEGEKQAIRDEISTLRAEKKALGA